VQFARLAIEAELRRRVRATDGVRIVSGVDVREPLHAAGRVSGVRYQARADGALPQTLPAALVVDCSGRASRTPQWLAQVLASRDRTLAAPTFSPCGLYLTAVRYDAVWGLPAASERVRADQFSNTALAPVVFS